MRTKRAVLTLAIVGASAIALMLAPTMPGAAKAGTAQDGSCRWERIATNSRQAIHFATAYDIDADVMYLYGGVDRSFAPVNTVQSADFSGASLRVGWSSVTAASALRALGAAGAYRAMGADSDASAAYFVGGMTDPRTGKAINEVQRYFTKAGTWERAFLDNASDLKARVFASAAYDPVHDVVWIVGGTSTCALQDVVDGEACNASLLPTQFLSFGDAAGEVTVHTLPRGDQQLFASSLVYDAARRRLLLFGGTRNIQRGEGAVRVLDLSDPDPSAATWSGLGTTGRGPAVYFHGGAAFADRDWMVVYGGTRQGFMQSGEADEQTTYALDLSVSPPEWFDLSPAGTPGIRVGGGMEYSPKHGAAIFVMGRDRYVPAEPPDASIQGTTFGLVCQPPRTPPTATATGTTAPPTYTSTSSPTASPTGPTPTMTATPTATNTVTASPTPSATSTVETPTPTPTSSPIATEVPSNDIYLPLVLNPCVDEVGESAGERQSCYGRPGDPSGHLEIMSEPQRPPSSLPNRRVTLYEVLGWLPDPPGTAPGPVPPGGNPASLTVGSCRTMDSRVDSSTPPDGVGDTWRYEPTADPTALAALAVTVATVEPAALLPPGSMTNPVNTDPNGFYQWFVRSQGCYFVKVDAIPSIGAAEHYSPIVGAGPDLTDANDVHHCYSEPALAHVLMQWGSGPNPLVVCTPVPPP